MKSSDKKYAEFDIVPPMEVHHFLHYNSKGAVEYGARSY